MHRRGICSVQGDVITLDGVTIEEVEHYHIKTLKLCLNQANEETDQHERAEAAAREREQEGLSRHEHSVDEAIERLEFD